MARPTAVLLTFAALAIAGCTGGRAASSADAAGSVERIRAGYEAVPDLTLEGTVQASGMPVTVWYDARIRARDSLKIVLTGPFGIPVGAMAATPDAFAFLDANAGDVVEGVPDRPTFQKLLMIPLDYVELVSLLRGEVPNLPEPGTYETTTDGSTLTLIARTGPRTEEITIDVTIPAVVRYRRLVNEGSATRTEIDARYESFTSVGGRPLARRARAEIAGGTQVISVTVDKARPEIDDDATLTLSIPAGTPRRAP